MRFKHVKECHADLAGGRQKLPHRLYRPCEILGSVKRDQNSHAEGLWKMPSRLTGDSINRTDC